MDYSNLRHSLLSLALLVSCGCLLLSYQLQLVRAQSVESDEQFEAYHHDIGRINPSSPGSSHVSPASIVKQLAPQQQQLQQPSTGGDYNSQLVAPITVPATVTRQQQQQQSRSRLRSSQSTTSGLSRLRTTTTNVDDSSVPVRVPLAAAPVPVVVPPSTPISASAYSDQNNNNNQVLTTAGNGSPIYVSNYNQQQYNSNEQPALASFRASSQYNTRQQQPVQRQQQQAPAALYQPTFSTSSQSAQQQQVAVTNNAAYLRSYPSASSSPVEALAPLPPAPVAGSIATASATAPLYSQLDGASVAAAASSLRSAGQIDQITAPSYEHVLSHGCPHHGVFSYPHADHCDRYYMCTNGTFTEEACPNGLSYGTQGAVYQHCAYRWNIDCGKKKAPGPISSPGCPWQFGVFPASGHQCSIHYHECEWGVPEVKTCHPEGLFYDERIKGCQWADKLGCKSEALLNFKCPHEDEDNPYWPFPRYYHSKTDVIVCVNEQPRLVHCTEDQIVDPSSLACLDTKKKKKKF